MNEYTNQMFLLGEVVKKDFSARYKDSVLGIIWSVLNPLLTMIILTIVFSTIFGGWIENYPVYMLSGRCIYNSFVTGVSISMNSIKGNQNILQKTSAPKYIFVLGGIISEIFNFIINLFLLFGVMIVTKCPFNITILFSIIPIISLIIMMTGVSYALSIIRVYYSDVQHIWTVVALILMYASALFYPAEIIPEPYQPILQWNPLFWIIDQFRDCIMNGVIPNTVNIINSFLISTIILLIGIIIFKKYEKKVTMKF